MGVQDVEEFQQVLSSELGGLEVINLLHLDTLECFLVLTSKSDAALLTRPGTHRRQPMCMPS